MLKIATLLLILLLLPFLPQTTAQPSDFAFISANLITSVAWSPDESKIATGQNNGMIKIWDTNTQQILAILQGHQARISSIRWHSNGTQLISGSFDETVRIWNVSSGQEVTKLQEFSSVITWAGWTPDDSQILVFVFDASQNLSIWDTTSYEFLEKKRGGAVTRLIWNVDNTRLAVADAGGSSQIWDSHYEYQIGFSEPSQTSSGGWFGVYALDWSQNEMLLVSGSYDGWIRLWDVSSERAMLNVKASNHIDVGMRSIVTLQFTENDTKIVSLTVEGILQVLDISLEQPIQTIQLDTNPIYAAEFSPDGTKLAYGGENGELKIVVVSKVGE